MTFDEMVHERDDQVREVRLFNDSVRVPEVNVAVKVDLVPAQTVKGNVHRQPENKVDDIEEGLGHGGGNVPIPDRSR